MKDWIEKIRKHAVTHYEEDGWDFLVECWTDEELLAVATACETYEEFVEYLSETLSTIAGIREDICATGF